MSSTDVVSAANGADLPVTAVVTAVVSTVNGASLLISTYKQGAAFAGQLCPTPARRTGSAAAGNPAQAQPGQAHASTQQRAQQISRTCPTRVAR